MEAISSSQLFMKHFDGLCHTKNNNIFNLSGKELTKHNFEKFYLMELELTLVSGKSNIVGPSVLNVSRSILSWGSGGF